MAAAAASSTVGPRAALLVVDMSVEQLGAVRYRRDEVVAAIKRLVESHRFAVACDCRLWLKQRSSSSTCPLAELYPGKVQLDIGLTPRVESAWLQLLESTVLSSH